MRYEMEICERVSISLWTLLVGILRSRRVLVVDLCMVPLMHAVITIGGRTVKIVMLLMFVTCHISIVFL